MQNIINVTTSVIGTETVNSVNARDLYKALELGVGQYSRWIKANLLDIFQEGVDFIGVRHNVEGNEVVSHILTLDVAKHLTMLSRTTKAKTIRDYFIQCEKELNKPLTIEQLLQENVKVITQLQEKVITLKTKIEEDKPKVLFAQNVSSSVDSLLIREWVKAISTDDVKIGQNKAFAWLRNNGYLMQNNEPYQKYINNGYFEVIERTTATPTGTKIFKTTKITGKGQVCLANRVFDYFNGVEE